MNICCVWLYNYNPDYAQEHILYLDHVELGKKRPDGGLWNASGYIVREKQGFGESKHRPVETVLTPEPMRYDRAALYWRERAAWLIRYGGYSVSIGSEYRAKDFIESNGFPPRLHDKMLEHLSQPNEYVFNEIPPREQNRPPLGPPEPPKPAPAPITLPPYNPAPLFTRQTPPARKPAASKPAASKPKPKPARSLPVNPGRRIILED